MSIEVLSSQFRIPNPKYNTLALRKTDTGNLRAPHKPAYPYTVLPVEPSPQRVNHPVFGLGWYSRPYQWAKTTRQAGRHFRIFAYSQPYRISRAEGWGCSIESLPHYYLACVLPTALHKNGGQKCQYLHARVRSSPWPNPFGALARARESISIISIKLYMKILENFNRVDYVYMQDLYIYRKYSNRKRQYY